MNYRRIIICLSFWAIALPAFAADELADPPGSSTGSSRSLLKSYTLSAQELAVRALSLIGIHYRRGGESPESGFDCSGFVRYIFRESLGLRLPRTSRDISQYGKTISREDLQPGDLVFFNTLRRGFSHVGIYLGDDRFVHAPASGGEVRVEDMRQTYWTKRFDGARRLALGKKDMDATADSE